MRLSPLESTIMDLGIAILSPDVSVPILYSQSLNCISDGRRRIFCVSLVLLNISYSLELCRQTVTWTSGDEEWITIGNDCFQSPEVITTFPANGKCFF